MKRNKLLIIGFSVLKVMLSIVLSSYLAKMDSPFKEGPKPMHIITLFVVLYGMFTIAGHYLSKAWAEQFASTHYVKLMVIVPLVFGGIIAVALPKLTDGFTGFSGAWFWVVFSIMALWVIANVVFTIKKAFTLI